MNHWTPKGTENTKTGQARTSFFRVRQIAANFETHCNIFDFQKK